MARPLIVGASGQVGSALAALLPDALLAGRTAPPPEGVVLDLAALAEDATPVHALLERHEISAVYCVGAATDVERCEREPAWAYATNAEGPATLARAVSERFPAAPFVFFSTDYVFDGAAGPDAGPPGPYSEEAATNPLSVYGRSKLVGEEAVLAAHPGALAVRTNVVYGPDRQGKNFLYTLRRLLSAGTTMRVPTDQINNPVYNTDLAELTVELVRAGVVGIVHVAGPEQLSRYDFAVLAAELLGLDGQFLQPVLTVELGQQAVRPLASGLRLDKLRTLLPEAAPRTVAQGVKDWLSSGN